MPSGKQALEPQPCSRVPEAALDVSEALKSNPLTWWAPLQPPRLHLRNHGVTPGDDRGRPRSLVGLTRGSFKAMPCPLPRSLCPQGDESRARGRARGRPPCRPAIPRGRPDPGTRPCGWPRAGLGSRAGQRAQEHREASTGPEGAGGRGPGKLKLTRLTRLGHGVWSAHCGRAQCQAPYIHSFIHSASLSRASSWARCHVGGWEPHDDQESHKWSCHPEHCRQTRRNQAVSECGRSSRDK